MCALGARAGNPDDLDLSLRLTGDPQVFHAGAPIGFEISYSTRTNGKYRATWTNPSPELDVVTLHLNPTGGVVDLRSLRSGAFAGSILSGVGNLETLHPVTQKADLADWYRFEREGHYQLRVSSSQVSRIRSAEEGGGLEPITLESNAVEFDILPRDALWETLELASALQDLDAGPAAHAQALHRLVLLDTPGSIRNLVSLFLASGDAAATSSTGDASEIYRGLEESGRPESIIPSLEAALEDPQRHPGSNLVDLLASLQVRHELGPPRAVPEDPARRNEWEAGQAKRNQAFQDYLARSTEKLLASLRLRAGPQRIAALYQAWWLAERHNSWAEEAPPVLLQLRQEVLASAGELPVNDLMGFVAAVWNRKSIPREQILPLLRNLALSAGRAPKEQQTSLQLEVYPLWCKASPRECDDAILAEAAKPDSPLLPSTILLMKEAEHPELDVLLKERLAAAATLKDSMGAEKTAALVLRAGGRNLRPAVQQALDQLAGNRSGDCEIRAYLLNYQMRFAPKDAARNLAAAFQDRESFCGWLDLLGRQRYSDDLIPIAFEALDSPNPATAASGALFLGAHGPADAEDVLWRHLDAFWDRWRDHAAELRLGMPGLSGPFAPAGLEQALMNALLHGATWKLTLAEQDRLVADCLSADCRKVAAGKVSLGY